MSYRSLTRRGALAAFSVLVLAPTAPASADQVVNDNQVVVGNQCVGDRCTNPESFAATPLQLKTANTPAIRLLQTNDLGWNAHTWDVAGNEANFFVRDVTNGSRLPLRIFPGAGTDSLRVESSGHVTTRRTFEQSVAPSNVTETGPADGATILQALRALPIASYEINGDSAGEIHVGPVGDAFHTAFGFGGTGHIAPANVAGAALAATKALDARVSDIALTPGPRGASGPVGPRGPAGPQGAAGAGGASPDALARSMKRANKRIRGLRRANRRLAKGMRKMRKQVARLARDR